MIEERPKSRKRELLHILKWIVSVAILLVVLALAYLAITDSFTVHAVAATALGVFFTVLIGSGLFALSFYSDESGHDQNVGNATLRRPPD